MVIAGCICLLSVSALAKDKAQQLRFEFAGKVRTYYLFAPDGEEPVPLVVLLHGSRANGKVMTDAWGGLASKEHFAIIAPDSFDLSAWRAREDGPDFIRAVIAQAKGRRVIDNSRIYLFGHSGGAVFALMLALIESEDFAAVAVHAGAIPPDDSDLFAYAKRRIPIAIWVGDHDPFFPLDLVNNTKKLFESNGFRVKVTVLAGQEHRYENNSEEINRAVWKFFRQSWAGSQTGRN